MSSKIYWLAFGQQTGSCSYLAVVNSRQIGHFSLMKVRQETFRQLFPLSKHLKIDIYDKISIDCYTTSGLDNLSNKRKLAEHSPACEEGKTLPNRALRWGNAIKQL